MLASQPVRFVAVGGTCFVSVVLIFGALRRVLPLPVAATIAYAIGAATSYELNRTWTFGRRERSWSQAARFLVITLAAMATNAGLLQTIVATHEVQDVAAEIIALACISPLTFLAYRFWGFRIDDAGAMASPNAAAGHAGAGSGE
jgi:putative flippase GtrA